MNYERYGKSSGLKVSLVLKPGSNLVRGGTEVMVDRTADELRVLGADVEYVTPLSRSLGDVVHFFGCFDAHWGVAEVALQRRIPIVWTPIYDSPRGVAAEGLRGLRKKATRTFPRLLRKLLEHTDRIITLTRNEEKLIQAFFRVGAERFRRVPHGVEKRFAEGDASIFRERFGIEGDFVIEVATITPRKNQLALIQALDGTGIPLVLVGPSAERDYVDACKKYESKLVRFLGEVDHDGALLPSAYAAATVFSLTSHCDVFPLAALEAAVGGCSLVFGSTWAAQDIYGDRALYAHPRNVAEIRAKVLQAIQSGRAPSAQAVELLDRYSWRSVTNTLKSVYEEIMPLKTER